MTWYRDRDALLAELRKYDFNETACARAHGLSQGTIHKWHAKFKATPPPLPALVVIGSQEIRVSGDFLILSDIHLPLTRYDLLEEAIDDALAAGIRRAIIAGDLLNLDAWSQYDPKQVEAGIPVEFEHAEYFMRRLLEVFDEVIIALGNHDARAHAALGFKVSFDKAMRMCLEGVPAEMMRRVTITDRDYVLIDTPQGVWRACHTRSYSRMPLAYPNKLALRHNQHIAAAHRHHGALGFAANGKFIVELGGLHDEANTAYLHRYTDDMPAWAHNWLILVEGQPYCPALSRARARVE